MPNYKISGYVGEACDIRLMRGNSFVGYKTAVPAGAYELVFALDSIENVDVVAVKSDGNIVGYGGITPVSTAGESNISIPPSGVPTIQTITVTMSSSLTTQSFGITIADPNKTVVFVNPVADYYSFKSGVANVSSITSSLITLYRYAHESTSAQFTIKLMEYSTGIKSLQRGMKGDSESPFTINSVNVLKSWPSCSGVTFNNLSGALPVVKLVSSTQLSAYVNVGYISWQVVEFN